MTTTITSAYSLLLQSIRQASTLSNMQKSRLVSRLEAGELTTDMKSEISAMCAAEISALNSQIADADTAIARQETFLQQENGRTDPHAEKLMNRHEESLQTIVDKFEVGCIKI